MPPPPAPGPWPHACLQFSMCALLFPLADLLSSPLRLQLFSPPLSPPHLICPPLRPTRLRLCSCLFFALLPYRHPSPLSPSSPHRCIMFCRLFSSYVLPLLSARLLTSFALVFLSRPFPPHPFLNLSYLRGAAPNSSLSAFIATSPGMPSPLPSHSHPLPCPLIAVVPPILYDLSSPLYSMVACPVHSLSFSSHFPPASPLHSYHLTSYPLLSSSPWPFALGTCPSLLANLF